MLSTKENPQPCNLFPRKEFLGDLLCGIAELERFSHKKIPRRLRGWRADLWRKLAMRERELRRTHRIRPTTPSQKPFLPRPFLETVKAHLMQKCFVAYLVAGAKYDELETATGASKDALRKRISGVARQLAKATIPATDVVEWEYAQFRFYDLQPEGKRFTENIEPPLFAWWEPAQALSQWERAEIVKLCADVCKKHQLSQRGTRGPNRQHGPRRCDNGKR